MSQTQLAQAISNSPNAEWFNKLTLTLNFPAVNYSKTYTGVLTLIDYVQHQVEGWEKEGKGQLGNLEGSRVYFREFRSLLGNLVGDPDTALHTLNGHWAHIQRYTSNVRQHIFPYDAPETQFLLNLSKKDPSIYGGAYAFITQENLSGTVANRKGLEGVIAAYEFVSKDSAITSRREAEETSLHELRRRFDGFIEEAANTLESHLAETNKAFKENVGAMEGHKETITAAYDKWFEGTQAAVGDFLNDTKDKISALETTYEEKLRLEKPANYWQERASSMSSKGNWLMGLFFILVITAGVSLYYLLWKTPEGMLHSFFGGDKEAALRWSIVFVTFISFLVVALRAVMKAMFSAFHLARDAEERARLTYVYLALIKDAKMEREDRQLVMQSLFSRADTGLLKDDSSPAMPGITNLFQPGGRG